MAVPADKTLKTLTGKYSMNKTLSGSPDPVFALQGVGYLTRKAIGLASISLDVTVYEGPPDPPSTSTDPVTHIDIEQSASGLTSTLEKRCLDDVFREHKDWLFGHVQGKTRFVGLDEVDDDFLKDGWDTEGQQGKDFMLSHVESLDNGWVARQVWGFQKINGERRYVRNVVVTKGKERVTVKLIYDYLD